MKIKLSPNCFKIDKPNFTALTKGFLKDGNRIHQAIWWDVKRKQYPTLFTLQKSNARHDYPLSEIGVEFNDAIRPNEYKHIADLVEEYYIDNTIELWERLCSNGIFDIWLPEAPFNRFKNAKAKPTQYRIALLRVYEIEETFQKDDIIAASPYLDKIKDTSKLTVTVKRPIIDDVKFKELKELLENTLTEFKSRPQHHRFNTKTTINHKIDKEDIKQNEITEKVIEKPKIKHLKINNFKLLNLDTNITFSASSILIGPNNSGKTTVLQALILWNKCIKTWFKERQAGNIKSDNSGAGINRLTLTSTLVKDAKLLWKNAAVKNIDINLTVGLWYNEKIHDCTVEIKYSNKEMIYAYLNENIINNPDLINAIIELNVKILYPVTNLKDEEPFYAEPYILSQIDAGLTNNVLINMCYILSHDINKWNGVKDLMKLMFQIELNLPQYDETLGTVSLTYKTHLHKTELPISLAGTGQQQILALLVFFGYQKDSVLMFDEPDAHLESLRQRQVFNLLKHLAESNNNQLIISTHSEVIINDSADFDINLMVGGDVVKLTDSAKQIKFFIRDFGMEHYYKAKLTQSVLYVEGSTDIFMLRAFAKKLNHNAKNILDGDFYYYYTCDNINEPNVEKILRTPDTDLIKRYERHFQVLKTAIPTFKAIGIFDKDNRNRQDEINGEKAILYWKKYELENYFVSVDCLRLFVQNEFIHDLNSNILSDKFWLALNTTLSNFLFSANMFSLYQRSSENDKAILFKEELDRKKGSAFLDFFFSEFHNQIGLSINKGEYYKIITFVSLNPDDEIEIREKLDLIENNIKCTQHTT